MVRKDIESLFYSEGGFDVDLGNHKLEPRDMKRTAQSFYQRQPVPWKNPEHFADNVMRQHGVSINSCYRYVH